MTPKQDIHLIPDSDRIAAAQWAARELLLPRFKHGTTRRWKHALNRKGAIISELVRRLG